MALFYLAKAFTFEAAHQLPYHDGKCARLHGHSWRLIVAVSGERLIESGCKQAMLVDYGDLKALVQPIVDSHLDHYFLNSSLAMESPTSEAIAEWLFELLRPRVLDAWGDRGVTLRSVVVEETCTSRCEVRA